MIPLHLHLDFDINTIKIYKKSNFFVIVSINDIESDVAKSKKIVDIVDHVLQLTNGYPEVNLKFWHLKGFLNEKKLTKLTDLIKTTKIVDRKTLISYMLLL